MGKIKLAARRGGHPAEADGDDLDGRERRKRAGENDDRRSAA